MAAPYRDDQDAVEERFAAAERELAEVRRKLAEAAGLHDAERDLAKEVEALRSRLDGLRRKRSLPMLERIAIASPCTADWNQMVGDDKVRFCGQCEKNVYNLSGMTRDEAEQLVREREGNACVRMYKRNDGTVLTTDCPVGVRRKRRRRFVAGTIGGGLIASAGLFTANQTVVMGGMQPRVMMGEMEPHVVMGAVAEVPKQPEPKGTETAKPAVDQPTVQPTATPSTPTTR